MIKALNDFLHSFLECKNREEVNEEERKIRKKALDDMNKAISALAKLFPSKFRIQDTRLVRFVYVYTHSNTHTHIYIYICIYIYI